MSHRRPDRRRAVAAFAEDHRMRGRHRKTGPTRLHEWSAGKGASLRSLMMELPPSLAAKQTSSDDEDGREGSGDAGDNNQPDQVALITDQAPRRRRTAVRRGQVIRIGEEVLLLLLLIGENPASAADAVSWSCENAIGGC